MPKKTERGAGATSLTNYTKVSRRTQEDVVLDYLRQHGTMTTLEAVTKLYVMNPQQRIKNLRKRGYDIETEYVRSAEGKRYGVYVLQEETYV